MTRDARADYAVYTGDRADDVVLDGLLEDCTALRQLDEDLSERYDAAGLVGDLWRAAYCRAPQVLAPGDIQPHAQINRAVASAQVGSPEHNLVRSTTTGDAYMAALAVVNQGTALRRMLRQLEQQREQAQQVQQQADQAAAAAGNQPGNGVGDGAGGDNEEETAEGAGEEGEQEGAEGAGQPGEEEGEEGESEGGEESEGAGQPAGEPEESESGEESGGALEQAEQELAEALAAADIRATARHAAQSAAEQLDDERGRAAAWGVEDTELHRMSADERMRLGDRLKSGKLAEFADLIGRFRQLARAQRSRRVEHARGEYVGVTLGDDLGSLIPSELANLAVPALRAEFAARYAESRLMVYDQRGEDRDAQGAIIALVDCSYSMSSADYGSGPLGGDEDVTPEAYAKALALALLDQARASNPARDFVAICFDETVDAVFRFPGNRPVSHDDRVDFAERFAGGGTDFMEPLDEAMTILAAEHNTTGRQKADIVLITDGDAPIDEDWVNQWWQTKKQLGFRCFGVEIGSGDSPSVAALADDTRAIADLAPASTADLFRSI